MAEVKRIEVSIPLLEIEMQGPSDAARGAMIINRMKAAGIPVLGVLTIQGCSHGALITFLDDMFGTLVWRWTSELPE